MKKSPIKKVGKVGKETAKGMKKTAPVVCERAGGMWCGWDAPVRCEGATCEWPTCGGTHDLEMCHIIGRGQQGDETPENIAVLCLTHHNELDHASEARREEMRGVLQEVTAHGIGG